MYPFIQFAGEEQAIKEFAFTELEKALTIYKKQKEILKTEFYIEHVPDKNIVRKFESRLSLLNTKINTILLALSARDNQQVLIRT
jgi:hypothetical protein